MPSFGRDMWIHEPPCPTDRSANWCRLSGEKSDNPTICRKHIQGCSSQHCHKSKSKTISQSSFRGTDKYNLTDAQ